MSISSRKQINDILQDYYETEQEFLAQIWNPKVRQWSPHKQAIYNNGVVIGKYLEHDYTTFSFCSEDITDKALQTEIKQYLEQSISSYEHKRYLDIMDTKKLESDKKMLYELLQESVDTWIERYCGWFDYIIDNLCSQHKRALVFLYYSLRNYSFIKKHPLSDETDILDLLFKDFGDKQSQYSKYGLVQLDDNRELMTLTPPRIYDKSIDRTLLIKNIPVYLLDVFDKMHSNGMIKDLSLRLYNEKGWQGRVHLDYIAEAVERGQIFDLVNLNNYSVTKLYSTEYEDCLWITIDSQNMTFEELCKDFRIHNDSIVTQVVHLQYLIENNQFYITHLDHEYIFYTIEEYENRQQDSSQKGTARPRLKSFKIDHSKIPFDFRCENKRKDENGNDLPVESEQFLCYVLECYFEHKELLREYFENVLKGE